MNSYGNSFFSLCESIVTKEQQTIQNFGLLYKMKEKDVVRMEAGPGSSQIRTIIKKIIGTAMRSSEHVMGVVGRTSCC